MQCCTGTSLCLYSGPAQGLHHGEPASHSSEPLARLCKSGSSALDVLWKAYLHSCFLWAGDQSLWPGATAKAGVCPSALHLSFRPPAHLQLQRSGTRNSALLTLPIAVLMLPGSSRHCWLPDTLFVTCAMRRKPYSQPCTWFQVSGSSL